MGTEKSEFGVVHVRTGGALLSLLCTVAVGCAPPADRHEEEVREVRQHLETSGPALVSVLLEDDAVSAAQQDIALALAGTGAQVLHNFVTSPGMAVRIDTPEALEVLANHPSVVSFAVNPVGGGGLVEAREIDGANDPLVSGFTGAGRVVAILDTGIERDHLDLSDNVADEACICNTTSDCCPNGTNEQYGVGAAAPDHYHGTFVSGIVTSAGNVAPPGIAPDTDIVMVRMMDNNTFNSFDDVTASLEWVLTNHPEVDAVNMSLQSGALYQMNCNVATDVYTPPSYIVNLSNAVDALHDAGILTVSISGNWSSKVSTTLPGCMNNLIEVGNSTKTGSVNSTSNSDAGVDLLAPGTDITSSALGNTTLTDFGTSYSSPQVAAAAAMMRQADPDLGVDEMTSCLVTSPTAITDTNGIALPLLHIPTAMQTCGLIGGGDCNTATLEAESMDHSVGGAAPEGWNIWSNGAISGSHDFTAGPATLVVRARGEAALGVWPHMVVRVDGVAVGDANVTSAGFADYTFHFVTDGGPAVISIAFDNDAYQPPEDRNLIVDSVSVGCAEPTEADLTATLVKYTDWGAGYCMGLLLSNTTSVATSSWSLELNLGNTQITDLWNANYSSTTGVSTLTPLSWNSAVQPGEVNQSIGFCASRPAGSNQVATVGPLVAF